MSFFVYALLHTPYEFTRQDFAKWNALLRYIPVVSFINMAFLVVKLKIFSIFHIEMKWPLFGGFGLLLSQILFNLTEILTRGSLPIRQTQRLKNPSNFWILAQMERTQNLQFWSILGPNLPPENQKHCIKPNFSPKLVP